MTSRDETADPRRRLLDGPWDFLADAERDEVLRTTAPWERLASGLSMGSCLRRPAGFDVVVTLDDRVASFRDLAPEPPAEHLTWSIVDGVWPDLGALVTLTGRLQDRLGEGQQVLVRCMAGLNRSGLVCAAVLVRQGANPQDAIDTVRRARSRHALCNPRFVELITRMVPGHPDLGLTSAHPQPPTMRHGDGGADHDP